MRVNPVRRFPPAPEALLPAPGGGASPALIPRVGAVAGHDEIGVAAAAFRAAQPSRPFRHRQLGAVPLNLSGDVGLDLVLAGLAPNDQPDSRPERAAKGHRADFWLVSARSRHGDSMSSRLGVGSRPWLGYFPAGFQCRNSHYPTRRSRPTSRARSASRSSPLAPNRRPARAGCTKL